MAEEYHQTAAPPEPTIYPVPDPDPAEASMAIGIHALIFRLNDELADATREYAAASSALDGAVIEEAEARQGLTWHETIARDHAYATGMPGSNEGARKAYLDRHLLTDNALAGLRSRLEEAQRARTLAEGRFRVADRACKDLNRRLDALGSIVRGGGGL